MFPEPLRQLLSPFGKVFVVYDRNVSDYALKICASAPEKPYPSFAITADEEHKTMDTVLGICRWLLEEGADRDALVLAVGGGVTTDMAGFAACIYKRGIRYANVPTTVLGQVDAAIGGKTGVNLDSYKNILGIIRQPEFTFIWPETLGTLPQRERLSGIAELLKTFIIGSTGKEGDLDGEKQKDEDLYRRAVTAVKNGEDLSEFIEKAGEIKRRIVALDERENDLRQVLNLGHTYGHAVEWYQRSHGVSDPLTHGEAVAAGIIRAAELSEETQTAPRGLAEMLRNDFSSCGLPTALPCPEGELQDAIRKDKKAHGGKVNFILIERIGKVIIKKI